MKPVVFAIFALLLCQTAAHASSDITSRDILWGADNESRFVEGQVLVWFNQDVNDSEIAECNQRMNATIAEVSSLRPRRMVLSVPAGQEIRIAGMYSGMPEVRAASVNNIYSACWQPNDPYYYLQWHFNKDNFIYLEEAWNIQQGGDQDVVVAIIDTGVAFENYPVPSYEQGEVYGSSYVQAPDLAGVNFVHPYDFVHNDPHPNDQNGHGTHVCGTVAQDTGDSSPGNYSLTQGYGVAGIAFNCSIMPIQALNYEGYGSEADIADGIAWASDHDADVINMSLGGSYSSVIEAAVVDAYDSGAGCIIVAATGNESASSIGYPAGLDEVIAVGSVQYDGTRAPYSNYGSGIDVVAPGGNTGLDQNNDGYADGVLQETFSDIGSVPVDVTSFSFQFLQGTSMASPHVAGVIALMISNGATPANVRSILHLSATDIGSAGYDTYYGYGLINCHAAVSASSGIGDGPGGDGMISVTPMGNNPFTRYIALNISAAMPAELSILDVSGRRIYSSALATDIFTWNGVDDSGRQVPAGVYFAVVRSGSGIGSCRLVRLR